MPEAQVINVFKTVHHFLNHIGANKLVKEIDGDMSCQILCGFTKKPPEFVGSAMFVNHAITLIFA